ncbi:MAG: LysM peptidoglycan-binding domain-containing protein [Luteolibacter sp.]|jgi:hypothetical protein
MKISIILKLFATIVVLGVLWFTGMLAWHVAVEPRGWIFERLIPGPRPVLAAERDEDFVRALESAEVPVVDPGEGVFQQAREMIVMGNADEAREKLGTIIHIYPASSAAPAARRILGEMNLDALLTTASMDGKIDYTVVSGDALFAIVNRHGTTLENLMHINGLTGFGTLKPGDRYILMPLDFRIIITPARQSLALWQEGVFIREYPIMEFNHTRASGAEITRVESKAASIGGRRVQALSEEYAGADKTIQLANGITIRAYNENHEERPRGIHLRRIDIEELNLLVRAGNEVEFR